VNEKMGTKKTKKINICLDLDQTLIWAGNDQEYMPDEYPELKKKANAEPFGKDNIFKMDKEYTIFERPGLQDFLDFLFDNFNVSVWTAASKDYALFVIKNILYKENQEARKLDWIFFSYHCDISIQEKKGTKDLSLLWNTYKLDGFSENNTFIIDDYDEVYETQPNNCIAIAPFNFTDEGSEKDSYLYKIRKQLEYMLSQHKKGKKWTIQEINQQLGVVPNLEKK